MLGFPYYNEIPVPQEPTIQELIEGLTAQQKAKVLEGFTRRIPADLFSKRSGIPKGVVDRLYGAISSMVSYSNSLMRGEVIDAPAVIDPETGETTVEAVYKSQPNTALQLLNAVVAEYTEDFSSAQVEAILTQMVVYSKHNGTGTWNYYKAEVVK